jgi:TRAP-type mannitol/chloroaromatic compound transport system permease small subunit
MSGCYFLFDNGHIRKDVVEQTNKEKSKVGIDQDLLHTHYFHNPHMLSCDVITRVVGPTSQHDVPT